MGILDTMNDPLMSLGMGLLSAAGPSARPIGVGQGLGMGMQEMQRQQMMNEKRKQAEMLQKMQQMQMDEMIRAQKKQEVIQALAKQSVLSPEQQAIGKFGPTNEGAQAIGQFKPQFDTEGFLSRLMGEDPLQAMQLKQSMVKPPIKLGEGEQLLDPTTYKPVATGMPKADSVPSAIKEYQFAQKQGFTGSFQDFVIQQKRAGAGQTNVFNNTKDDFKNERDLRNDFAGLPTTKAFKEVESAHRQISVALKQNSPAGDLAGATKIMKILDPGSVVRESELGMAMQASGLMDRVANYAEMVLKGTKLTPTQRKDFQNLADKLYAEAATIYDRSVNEYQGVAKDYKLNPDRVAKPSGQAKTVVKTGVYGGRKVVKYSDGSTEYAD